MPSLNADEALRTRRSVRAFLPTPVPRATVEELLALASRSPSGSNIQPWKVRVVAGEARTLLRVLQGGPALPPGRRDLPTDRGYLISNVSVAHFDS